MVALGHAGANLSGHGQPTSASAAQPDRVPLASWKDGKTRQAILKFVAEVTTKGGPKFVPPEERIATFDNDGTLWCEHPVVQLAFVNERLLSFR